MFERHAILSLRVNLCTFAYYSMTFIFAFIRCAEGLVNFDRFLLYHVTHVRRFLTVHVSLARSAYHRSLVCMQVVLDIDILNEISSQLESNCSLLTLLGFASTILELLLS